MKINIIGSTKTGYKLTKDEALDFSGKSAGICYLPDTVETLFNEPKEKTIRRVNGNLSSGHFSVFGHVSYNLVLEGIPKILAMILNNEKIYNTSEKSARYTKMVTEGKEKDLYDKWVKIFSKVILEKYPKFEEKRVIKLAQENARYLISVFTPATTMEYTVSFQQLNFIIGWFEDYIKLEPNNSFSSKLKVCMQEFLDEVKDLKQEGLNSRMKGKSLSLFASRNRKEEFGENYCTNYLATFAELAQAQRHRTISYEMKLLDEARFYIPPIIKGTELEEKWLNDITSLKENYPQGMLIEINERGTIENFVLKCTERLCGQAQLEIMEQTAETMKKYLQNVSSSEELYNYLLPYSKGARCTFPNWKCTAPCIFGGKNAMIRKI